MSFNPTEVPVSSEREGPRVQYALSLDRATANQLDRIYVESRLRSRAHLIRKMIGYALEAMEEEVSPELLEVRAGRPPAK